MTRILAVDPGDLRIGLAISDPTGMLASPLQVLKHVSREADAGRIVQIAEQNGAGLILIGQSLDDDGVPTLQGRKSGRLGEAIMTLTAIPVAFWDESFTTQDAWAIKKMTGASRSRRKGHLDDTAAAVLLQSYLDRNLKDTP